MLKSTKLSMLESDPMHGSDWPESVFRLQKMGIWLFSLVANAVFLKVIFTFVVDDFPILCYCFSYAFSFIQWLFQQQLLCGSCWAKTWVKMMSNTEKFITFMEHSASVLESNKVMMITANMYIQRYVHFWCILVSQPNGKSPKFTPCVY